MKNKIFILLISATFIISCKNNSNSKSGDLIKVSKNQSLIDSLMKVSHERGVFNGNILAVKNDKIIYQNEFGYTDGTKSKKLTENSIFNFNISSLNH